MLATHVQVPRNPPVARPFDDAPPLAGAPLSRRSRVTLCTPKVSWTRCSSAGRACSPRSRLPASVESVSASALDRAASDVRRAARSTTRDTSDAITMKTISARTFSGAEIVNVWIGGTK